MQEYTNNLKCCICGDSMRRISGASFNHCGLTLVFDYKKKIGLDSLQMYRYNPACKDEESRIEIYANKHENFSRVQYLKPRAASWLVAKKEFEEKKVKYSAPSEISQKEFDRLIKKVKKLSNFQ